MTVGPWVIGSLVEGRIGTVFAWGVVMFEAGQLPSQNVELCLIWRNDLAGSHTTKEQH